MAGLQLGRADDLVAAEAEEAVADLPVAPVIDQQDIVEVEAAQPGADQAKQVLAVGLGRVAGRQAGAELPRIDAGQHVQEPHHFGLVHLLPGGNLAAEVGRVEELHRQRAGQER